MLTLLRLASAFFGDPLFSFFRVNRAWWRFGRVDAFRPEGRGFESCSRDLGQVLHLQLPETLML